MRLDSLGSPPLVQTENAEKDKVGRLKAKLASEPVKPPDMGGSSYQQDGAKLGQILDILKRAQQKNKNRKRALSKVAQEVLKKYQKNISWNQGVERTGQTLNLKA